MDFLKSIVDVPAATCCRCTQTSWIAIESTLTIAKTVFELFPGSFLYLKTWRMTWACRNYCKRPVGMEIEFQRFQWLQCKVCLPCPGQTCDAFAWVGRDCANLECMTANECSYLLFHEQMWLIGDRIHGLQLRQSLDASIVPHGT